MSTPTVPEPATVPVESPALPYAEARRTEVERLRFAAGVAATACCDVWDEVVADLIGGVS